MSRLLSEVRRVLITGCSSGIGRALAQVLTQMGDHVIATGREMAGLETLDVAQRLVLDVTSESSVVEAVEAAGRVDVLVNNAGVGLWGPVEAASAAQVEHLFKTNVFGPLRLVRAVAPQMRSRRSGSIVQISSAAGSVAGPLVGIYAATKHALDAYSQALRIELAPFGIKVAIVELGAVESAFGQNRENAALPGYEQIVDAFTKRLMSMRTAPASSEEVAASIADIVQDPAPKLRYRATADAERIVAARRAMSDDDWESSQLEHP